MAIKRSEDQIKGAQAERDADLRAPRRRRNGATRRRSGRAAAVRHAQRRRARRPPRSRRRPRVRVRAARTPSRRVVARGFARRVRRGRVLESYEGTPPERAVLSPRLQTLTRPRGASPPRSRRAAGADAFDAFDVRFDVRFGVRFGGGGSTSSDAASPAPRASGARRRVAGSDDPAPPDPEAVLQVRSMETRRLRVLAAHLSAPAVWPQRARAVSQLLHQGVALLGDASRSPPRRSWRVIFRLDRGHGGGMRAQCVALADAAGVPACAVRQVPPVVADVAEDVLDRLQDGAPASGASLRSAAARRRRTPAGTDRASREARARRARLRRPGRTPRGARRRRSPVTVWCVTR